jgi:hypothetical protein
MICSPSMGVGMSATGASGQRLLHSTGGLLKLMNFVLQQTAPHLNASPSKHGSGSPSKSTLTSSDKVIVGKALGLVHQLCALQIEEPSAEILSGLSAVLHEAVLSVRCGFELFP